MERKRRELRASIVVLGEKDHGKSTLLGRLLYETGGLPKDRLREVRKAMRTSGKRFEWAHLLDAFRYEREHEMTLDTSRIIVKMGQRLYECIDVPGHRELIKNMLSGASDARYAILVVEAASGIAPQTILHLEIAKFLGVKKLIAVINKCDLIGYSREQFEGRKLETAAALAQTGFKNAPILPLNAATGDNMLAHTQRLRWFRDPTMLEAIKKSFRAPARQRTEGVLVFAVQDVYPNSMAVGHVVQGRMRRGEQVTLMPGGSKHRVKNIFIGGREAAAASGGDQIGVLLAPAPWHIRRGDIIAKKRFGYSKTLFGQCLFTEKPPRNVVIESNFRESKATLTMNRGSFVVGKPVPAALTLKNAIAITGRFVIKKDGSIIGIGKPAPSVPAHRPLA